MSIYKRGGIWWVSLTGPTGKRIRESAETSERKQAQEYHDRCKSELWRDKKLGDKRKRTWEEAALQWLNESADKKSIGDDGDKIEFLTKFFGGLALEEITRELIWNTIEKEKAAVTATTRNRYYALIRAILNRATNEWEWIDKAPKVRMHSEGNGRIRYLTVEQVKRLLEELPEHQRDMVTFALTTGLRAANVKGLRWSQVDLERKVATFEGDEMKAAYPLGIPLNELAVAVVEKQKGKHKDYVFTYEGQPISNHNTKAWTKALKRAGIENFRWHDLRHTWASLLIQNGVDMRSLQDLGGWQNAAMPKRYSHLAPEHLRGKASVIDGLLG